MGLPLSPGPRAALLGHRVFSDSKTPQPISHPICSLQGPPSSPLGLLDRPSILLCSLSFPSSGISAPPCVSTHIGFGGVTRAYLSHWPEVSHSMSGPVRSPCVMYTGKPRRLGDVKKQEIVTKSFIHPTNVKYPLSRKCGYIRQDVHCLSVMKLILMMGQTQYTSK